MPKRLCLAALVLGVSACDHAKDVHLADGGTSVGVSLPADPNGTSPDSHFPEITASPDARGTPGGVASVRFRISYGECSGFCNHELLVNATAATLRTWTNPPNDSHTVAETLALDENVTRMILDAADQTLSNPWESRYGCPDCADQGAIHLEIEANGTLRATDLDPDQHPTLFDPLIAAIQPVMAAHPGPKSICALDPAHCTPGKVSLVLGLDKNGALEPTWYNDLTHTVFLRGCTTVTFERVEGDTVTWSGPAAYCGWEGYAYALGFTDLTADLALNAKDKPGTYRATGIYFEGCTPGQPISQAACTNQTTVTSNSITVTK